MANQVIKGLGFHHIALMANDFEASKRFYEALGMTVITQWSNPEKTICMYDIGDGGILELFSNGGDHFQAEGKYAHLAFRVENVEEAYKIALEAGARSHIAPKVVYPDAHPKRVGLNVAFVLGPSGEQIEFFKFVMPK